MKLCLFIAMTSLFGCNTSTIKFSKPTNDTTKVIEVGLRTAFFHENLPEISPLKKIYGFKDSILLTSDSLLLYYLPKTVDSIHFKPISRNDLFRLFELQSDLRKIPNYLSIGAFEKNDTGYYISIKSLSYSPYGGGGAIGIYITKLKDSLIVNRTVSSSIN